MMGRFLLILVLMSFVAFAQAQEKKEAYKFFEFEKISDSLLKEKIEQYCNQLSEEGLSQGYVINYGTSKEISKRERKIRNLIVFRNHDQSRLTFVQGGNSNKPKTIFWIVPEGAEPPKPE
jgi:hypothetical protein